MLEFQCGVCGAKKDVWSNKTTIPVDVNDAAVLGITAIGLGSYHLNELCSNLEIPCMSNYMYDKTQKKQQKDWWELAKKEASYALMEEMRLAKLDGKVDEKGNALITVVVDGSWPKRSYNRNFTSLSGCAVVIGMRTNKVIYFDVKDKYCHICKIAQSKKVEPRVHECNTNYRGPSSSMETTIVVEGFQYCERLGARFNEFVADGDSSTFKTITDMKIYQDPEVEVEKDECCNHLYRNFRKAFEALKKATRKFSKDAREIITKKTGNYNFSNYPVTVFQIFALKNSSYVSIQHIKFPYLKLNDSAYRHLLPTNRSCHLFHTQQLTLLTRKMMAISYILRLACVHDKNIFV